MANDRELGFKPNIKETESGILISDGSVDTAVEAFLRTGRDTQPDNVRLVNKIATETPQPEPPSEKPTENRSQILTP